MTISWTKAAGELAVMSAQRVQMLGNAQSLDAHRFSVWKDHANDLLKVLQTQGPNEWRRREQTVAPVAGTAAYTLNPRPYKVHDTLLWKDASGRDMPVNRWNRDQYLLIPYKATQGYPSCFIVERDIAATVIRFWPVPNAYIALGSFIVPYDRVVEDVVDPNSVMDLPQEWIGVIADALGVRLATSFNLENKAVAAAEKRADAGLAELLGDDHDFSLFFTTEN